MKNKIVLDTNLSRPQTLYPYRKKWILIGVSLLFLSILPLVSLYFGMVAEKDKLGVGLGIFFCNSAFSDEFLFFVAQGNLSKTF